jgi:ferrous iron transport protein A
MMPLIFAKEGETVTIRRISGKDDVRQHLAELGFVMDAEVLIVSYMAGNLIVQVKGSRIALDKSMAQRIFF